jgi:hypothetical protein
MLMSWETEGTPKRPARGVGGLLRGLLEGGGAGLNDGLIGSRHGVPLTLPKGRWDAAAEGATEQRAGTL